MKKLLILFVAMCCTVMAYAQTSNKVITYTATERIGVSFSHFGEYNKIESHVYDSGTQEGKIIFVKDVTTIGESAFSSCTSLISINLPASVTTIGESAFSFCTSLISINLPASVTTIGESAFSFCTSLTSIDLSDGLYSIGKKAFAGCTSLISINLPEGVSSIGESAFWDCTSLTSVTINSQKTLNVLEYFSHVFGEQVTEVVLNGNITTIPDYKFYLMSNLQAITISASVTSIDDCAFFGCTWLSTINLPEGLTSIGEDAFAGCTSLASIELPTSVATIGQRAFDACTGLKDITVDWTTPLALNTNVFDGVDVSSCTLHIPSGSLVAYTQSTVWCNFKIRDNSQIISFKDANVKAICLNNWDISKDGELSTAEAALVTTLGTDFKNNTEITSFNELQYFTRLETIAEGAFEGCEGLTAIIIPSNVVSIGDGAFSNCYFETDKFVNNSTCTSEDTWGAVLCDERTEDGLCIKDNSIIKYLGNGSTVEIPDYVTGIEVRAFESVTSLESIEIPSTITSIGEYAFMGCSGLKDITVKWTTPLAINANVFDGVDVSKCTLHIPSESLVAYMQSSVWRNFKIRDNSQIISFDDAKVKAICVSNWDINKDGELSEGEASLVTDLGTAFNNNTEINNFKELQYFTGLTSIAEGAFNGCRKLTSITLPDGLKEIGVGAFSGCSGFNYIEIPNSVTTIGNSAFYNCTKLTSIEIPNSISTIENSTFYDCSALQNITIPNSVITIGNNAFLHCTSLEYLTIPNSVTSIGEMAFFMCQGVTSIEIPNSVTTIGNYAFYGCDNVQSITLHSLPSIGMLAFEQLESLTLTSVILDLTDSDKPYIGTSLKNYPSFTEANYHCSIEPGKWGTIILSFVPESTEGQEFYELKDMTTMSGDALMFTKTDEVKAGVPYLFRNVSENADFTLARANPTASDFVLTPQDYSIKEGAFTMKGSFQTLQLDGRENMNLYYLKDNEFCHTEEPIHISPFRAYIEGNGSSNAKSFTLLITDDYGETSIPGIMNDKGEIDETEGIYDLNGRKLSAPQKGQVNIIRTKSGKSIKQMF